MKKLLIKRQLLLMLLAVLFVSGCRDRVLRTFTANVPVYQSEADFRATTFALGEPQELRRPGKIYVWGQYLFINERMQGVHFFDNSNPSAPLNLGFLPIHANADIAIKGTTLYADNYYDLLAFDITDINNPSLISRVENVFDFNQYGYISGYDLTYPIAMIDPAKGVVIGWNVEKVTEKDETSGFFMYRDDVMTMDMAFSENNGSANPQISGLGGSMARFTIFDNFLYTLEDWQLGIFNISGNPVHSSDISLSRSSETLWQSEGYLYIGTTTGMLIYDLADPSSPSFKSDFSHVTSCDPVVVQGDKAFVTLSTGNTCWGNVNELDVVDLSDISNPQLLHTYNMTNPKGLGIDGNTLFLCDGSAGLKVFDKTDLSAIDQNMISAFPGITAWDVIPYNGVLIMTSEEGIFQYDYSNLGDIYQLSLIPIQQ